MTDSGPSTVQAAVLRALQQHVFDNQGLLTPRHLAAISAQIAELATADAPPELGAKLSQAGLALSSLLAAASALLAEIQQLAAANGPQVTGRIMGVVQQFHQAEMQRLLDQQEQTQQAIQSALLARDRQAAALQQTIHELSTPIVPVYQGVLIVPLIGTIDSGRSSEITDRLLAEVAAYRATTVIIDITAVPVVDTSVAQHLLAAAQAVGLLGAEAMLVGINPEIAQTIVQLGIDLGQLRTLPNLEQGLADALRRRGLAI